MKTIQLKLLLLALLSTLNPQLSTCFAQGSLTPPGPPGATMLTLSQVEPRTPISSGGFIITNSGSYYLTANLVMTASGSAVSIGVSGVTLDLNGFTISSTFSGNQATTSGILIGVGLSDITILNGHITSGATNNAGVFSGPGFPNGIDYSTTPNNKNPPLNVHVSSVSVSGCLDSGIDVGIGNSMVESCAVQTIGGYGIEAASVFRSTAVNCGNDGIIANNASDCYGYSIGGSGVYVNQTADNCSGYSTNGDGVDAENAYNCTGVAAGGGYGVDVTGIAENCYGSSYSGEGVVAFAANGGVADNCYGFTSTGGSVALYAAMANNCYGVAATNGSGLYADYGAINCVGYGSGNGQGIFAGIAIGCFGGSFSGTGLQVTAIGNSSWGFINGPTGTPENVANKYNMQ